MQGDDSKEGKDSKRLSRAELLEMLIEQSKEVESLKKKVDELQKQLDDRTIQLQQTGSIAADRFDCRSSSRIKRHIQSCRSGSIPIHRKYKAYGARKECRVPGASPEDT